MPAESSQYREIRLESLNLHPESFGSNFEEQSKLPKLKLQEAIEQPSDTTFVIGAFDRQLLVGICGFIPFTSIVNRDLSNAGTIIQVYVRPAYRGKKIGFGLLDATLHEAFKNNEIHQVTLGVWAGNKPAIQVYHQAGFETLVLDESQPEENDRITHYMVIRRSTLNRE